MRRKQFKLCLFLSIYLICSLLYSCTRIKQNRYVSQIKSNLTVYDSVTSVLISKYSARSIERPTIIYPSEKDLTGDHFRIFDTSINHFCSQNDISYIEVQSAAVNADYNVVDVTYFLSDNNYQYVFNSKGFPDDTVFENTRVRVVPINNKWQFQYEKSNF